MGVRLFPILRSNFCQSKAWQYPILRHCSDNRAVKQADKQNVGDTTNIDYKILNVQTKVHQRLPCRQPLVKNFFVGEVDSEFLAFPEVISRDDISKLYDDAKQSESFFVDTLNVQEIEQTRSVSEKTLDDIRQFNLFGANVPHHLGGKGYLVTESLLAAEPETECVAISSILSSHRTVCDIINEFGTDEQKAKYLPQLASGAIVATEAIYESGPIENNFFDTTAHFDKEEKCWTLSGTKSFITNGTKANLFLVLAQNRDVDSSGQSYDAVKIFLIDSTLAGLSKDAPQILLGCHGSEACKIHLNKVKVTEGNVIGTPENMSSICAALFKMNRLRTGWLSAAIMKKICSDLAIHCIHTRHGSVQLKDTELVSSHISKIACATYAIESMTYFTSALLDEFDKQDTDLEAAILKIYSLENLLQAATSAMGFVGADVLVSGNTFETHYRNASHLYAYGECLDNLKMYVGLAGLQHAGTKLHEIVKKERNPLFNPGHVFRSFFDTRKVDNPKLTLNLGHDLHPSLAPAAQWLEQSILRLQMGTEIAMSRHGSEIVDKHTDILRLSECGTLLYAMFASISRASRSYCIGIKHSDYELLMASVICNEGMVRIRDLIKSIVEGPFIANDKNHGKIAKQIFKSYGYFCDHPTKYNY